MPVFFSILLALLVLQQLPLMTSRGIFIVHCPTCQEGRGPPPPHQGEPTTTTTTQQQQSHHPPGGSSESSSAMALVVGDPCGVYTQRCAPGLRCTPPDEDPRPLRALLDGRGVCRSSSSNATVIRATSPTHRVHTTDSAVPSKDPEKAPCGKMLMRVLEGLDTQVFQAYQDIYLPNCDKQGFFRKKQCRTWRGSRHRAGRCWCVDKNGSNMSCDIGT